MNAAFSELLADHIQHCGYSQSALARDATVDPSYVARLTYGQREPPRAHIVLALARSLHLSPVEWGAFFVAAGHAPPVLTQLGWPAVLQDVAEILSDPRVSDEERAEFATVVRIVASRYKPGARPVAS